MKVVVLVAGANVEPHSANEEAQRLTWGKNFSSQIYWVHGSATLSDSGHHHLLVDREARRIDVGLSENFSNLFEKTLLAISWVNQNHDFDFVIRSNTSSFWNEERLLLLSARLPRSGLYGGHLGTWSEEGDSWDYVGGAGLFMSRDIAELACKADVVGYRHLPDDVALGLWMRQLGVKPVALPVRSNVTDYHPVYPNAFTRLKHWNRGSITRSRMTALDRVYSSRRSLTTISALVRFNCREIATIAFDFRKQPGTAVRLILLNLWSWPGQFREFTALVH